MAYVVRLIASVALWVCCSLAYALVPAASSYRGETPYGSTAWVGSGSEACALVADKVIPPYTAGGWTQLSVTFDGATGCPFTGAPSGSSTVQEIAVWSLTVSAASCPANSASVSGGCQCNNGYVENSGHTACVPQPTGADKWKQWCQAANGQELGFVEVKGRAASTGCQNLTLAGSPISTPGYVSGDVPTNAGCSISLKNVRSFPDTDGTWYSQGDATVTGGTCREGEVLGTDPAGTQQKPVAAPPPCVGGYQGTVNGSTVCVKPDATNGVDWNGTQRVTNPDGSSTVTDTQTTCKGNTCTTQATVTTMNAGGTPTGTSTTGTTETLGSLCSRDKGNGVCSGSGTGPGDESSFKGSCATGFVAKSEDAVLNAMALEQHKRNCQLLATDGAAQTEVAAEMAKTGNRTTDNPNNSSVSIGAGNIDQSDALGGGSCNLNKQITVRGFTATLPFGDLLCSPLQAFGLLLVGVAMLLAGRIVTRG